MARPFLISDPYPALCCDNSSLPAECKQSHPINCPLPDVCNLPDNCIKNKPCEQPTAFSISIDNGPASEIPITLNENNEPYVKYDLESLTDNDYTLEVSVLSSVAQSCPASISFRKGKPSKVTGFYIQ